jgi:hypothetical protein
MPKVPYPEIPSAPSPEPNNPMKYWGRELRTDPPPSLTETDRLAAAVAPPTLSTLLGYNSSKSHLSEPPPSPDDSAIPHQRHSPAPSSSPRFISTQRSPNQSSPKAISDLKLTASTSAHAISELKLTASSDELTPSEKSDEQAPSSPVTSNDLDFLVGPPGHGPCLRHTEFYFEGLTVTFLVRASLVFFFSSWEVKLFCRSRTIFSKSIDSFWSAIQTSFVE